MTPSETLLKHRGLVNAVAISVARTLPCHVDEDDLRSEGTIGLMRAIDRFDPSRSVPFTDFAKHRIRGAMFDWLRRIDWATRDQRAKLKKAEREHWENEEKTLSGSSKMVSLEHLINNADPDVTLYEPRTEEPEPKYVAELALKRCGVIVLDSLKPRLRKLMLLRYWHGLTLKETGAELGISEPRAFQLEKQACEIVARELKRRGIHSLRDVI